jgi:regulation of enolase protein 1 (concanavalin A-like superfamily)
LECNISSTVDSTNAYSTQQIVNVIRNSSGLYMNSPETKFTSSAVADLTSSGNWDFGNGASYGFLNGNIQEKIIYLSDQTSNQSAIQTNINTYYGVY